MSGPSAIFRPPTPAEAELAGLRAELSLLRAALTERERALDDLRRHLLSFEGRYLRQVGKLLKQLDEWEQKTAALHPGREHHVPEDWADESPAPEAPAPAPRANANSAAALRGLFRELALRIHPDHATDADDEARRTHLMAQANDAFRRKDHRILRRMLHGFDPGATLLTRSLDDELAEAREALAQTRQDIAAADTDRTRLEASDLAQLERDTLAAALAGRDLLAEMAARIKGRIGLAMRQYELDLSRIKRPGRGLSVEDVLSAEAPARSRR